MLINLHNELWISFILSHPLITELIALPVDDSDEELTEHYISFLKSLSIRLDAKQINLFYNKVLRWTTQEILYFPAGIPSPAVLQPLRQYGPHKRDEPHSRNNEKYPIHNPVKHERVTRYF
jgi:hypothetical protein